jgi:diguanylate cyclase (GGDEF)-like protein/PAS domain S-box-containing protein
MPFPLPQVVQCLQCAACRGYHGSHDRPVATVAHMTSFDSLLDSTSAGPEIEQDAKLPAVVPARPRRSRMPMMVLAALACVFSAILAGRVGFTSAAESQFSVAAQGLASFTSALASLLERYESLPRIVALDSRVTDVLARPLRPESRAVANAYLESVAQRGGLLAAFVIDRDGLTLASSNWNTAQSFVGRSYDYRPYFRDAMSGGIGRFYAIGSATNEPGYFIAWPVYGGGQVQGVVAVKVSLRALQDMRSPQAESLAVADGHGVIFLASDPALRYRPIAPLTEAASATLAENKTYGNELQAPLQTGSPLQAVPTRMRLADGREVSAVSQTIPTLNWRAVAFVAMAPAYRAAAAAAFAGGAAAAFVVALIAFVDLRRQRAADVERSLDVVFRSQQRLRTVADNLPMMVCFIDHDERYVFANNAFAQHYGLSVADVEGRHTSEVLPPEEREEVAHYLARAWFGETVVFEREYRHQRGFRFFEATFRPEWNAQHTRVAGVHVMTQDVTATRRRINELSRSAQLDHLTQLLNRKGFDAQLSQAVNASDEIAWVALLFIDLDDFKPVNDRHGHAAGDALLKAFGQRLSNLVRATDAVARLGGDEFAVILPGVITSSIAERLAENIVRMASTPFTLDGVEGVTVQIGASVGVAVAAPGITAEALCKRADTALYLSKQDGKGHYHLDADDSLPMPLGPN